MKRDSIRLSYEYIAYIKKLAKDIFSADEIKIFGSRIDRKRKGGDIDIFIKTPIDSNLLDLKIKFLWKFKKKFGLQKIDLIIKTPNSVEKKIFKIAEEEGIKI